MTPQHESTSRERSYPPLSPVQTGISGRCPRCGEGKLFSGLLKIAERCDVCDLDYGFAAAGDGPAVFVIFIVGAIATIGVFYTEFVIGAPYWLNLTIWISATLLLSLVLLIKIKGLLVSQQYVKKAAEGRLG